jgi:hypothetical protein
MFDKDSYAKLRKQGKRGQGEKIKPAIKRSEPTIIFVNGRPTYATRAQRRLIKRRGYNGQ